MRHCPEQEERGSHSVAFPFLLPSASCCTYHIKAVSKSKGKGAWELWFSATWSTIERDREREQPGK